MNRARLLEKMPTVIEITDAVIDSSFWKQVLLVGLTSDLQLDSELPLADMAGISLKEKVNGKYLCDSIRPKQWFG